MKNVSVLEREAKGCFDFFWKEAVTEEGPAYGLIRDNTAEDCRDMASIASVGFGLSAYIIGVERGWITYAQAEERTLKTLQTLWASVEQVEGFFYHFLDMKTGKKYGDNYDCASIIDTSLLLNGAFTSAVYFGGEIENLVQSIYERVNWTTYYNEADNVFYMGYDPDTGGFGAWDMYAEQLMQYTLGVASPTHPVPASIYDGFKRELKRYGKYEFYTSPGNPLFTHQYSHAWYDFRNVVDVDGINWFDNSRQATLAQRQYAIDHATQFKTFHENSWGLTACQGPFGYKAYGAMPFVPSSDAEENDGTVAPTAASGSIVFTPEESVACMSYFEQHQPALWGAYGLLDAYNLDLDQPWYADRVIGIDKGITLLMIENERSGLIWSLYMQHPAVKEATRLLKWSTRKDVTHG